MPIRWRLTLYIALVIGAILLVLGFALYYLNRSVLLSGVEATARTRATDAARTIESGKNLSDAYVGQLTLDGVVLLVRDGRGGLVRKENLPENGKIENTIWRRAYRSGKPASGMTTISGDDPYYVYAVPANPRAGPTLVVEAVSAVSA